MKSSNLYKILIFFILLIPGCGSPHIANLYSSGSTIVCFGDSITSGTGASEGEDYPAYLSKLLKKDVINAGTEGDTTASALDRLDRDVLGRDPYIVIVELGGNDFLEQIPRKDTLENLKAIISRIQDRGAMVVLCDMSSGFILSGYRSGYKMLAREKGCIFVPRLLEGILINTFLMHDQVHPNSAGYKIIAKRIYVAIAPYIK